MSSRAPLILVINDQEDMLEATAFFLRSQLGAEIKECQSIEEGERNLKSGTDFNCVVTTLIAAQGQLVMLKRAIESTRESVPWVVCMEKGAGGPIQKSIAQLAAAVVGLDEIHDTLSMAVGRITGHLPQEGTSVDYCGVRLRTFLGMSPIEADLYLKLMPDRYLKVMSAGQAFEFGDFERYLRKGVHRLYVRGTDARVIARAAVDSLKARLEEPTKVTPATLGSQMRLSMSAVEVISDLNASIGFSPEVVELTQAAVDSTLQTLEARPELREILAEIFARKDRFLGTHSIATAHVACGLAHEMGWYSETTFRKLASAGILHDISLREEEYAILETQLAGLTAKERSSESPIPGVVLEHPRKAVETLARKMDYVPDLDKIILQHHERPDGTGFPGRLEHKQIHPLAAVFNVAHEMVCFYFIKGRPVLLSEFVGTLGESYSRGTFGKIIKILMRPEGL